MEDHRKSKSSSDQELEPHNTGIKQETTIKIAGITKNITTKHLEEIFGLFGNIKETAIIRNKKHATIIYATMEEMEKAIKLMNAGQIDGSIITVTQNILQVESKEDLIKEVENIKKSKNCGHPRNRYRECREKESDKGRERSRNSSLSPSDSGSISSSQSLISSNSSSSSK